MVTGKVSSENFNVSPAAIAVGGALATAATIGGVKTAQKFVKWKNEFTKSKAMKTQIKLQKMQLQQLKAEQAKGNANKPAENSTPAAEKVNTVTGAAVKNNPSFSEGNNMIVGNASLEDFGLASSAGAAMGSIAKLGDNLASAIKKESAFKKGARTAGKPFVKAGLGISRAAEDIARAAKHQKKGSGVAFKRAFENNRYFSDVNAEAMMLYSEMQEAQDNEFSTSGIKQAMKSGDVDKYKAKMIYQFRNKNSRIANKHGSNFRTGEYSPQFLTSKDTKADLARYLKNAKKVPTDPKVEAQNLKAKVNKNLEDLYKDN